MSSSSPPPPDRRKFSAIFLKHFLSGEGRTEVGPWDIKSFVLAMATKGEKVSSEEIFNWLTARLMPDTPQLRAIQSIMFPAPATGLMPAHYRIQRHVMERALEDSNKADQKSLEDVDLMSQADFTRLVAIQSAETDPRFNNDLDAPEWNSFVHHFRRAWTAGQGKPSSGAWETTEFLTSLRNAGISTSTPSIEQWLMGKELPTLREFRSLLNVFFASPDSRVPAHQVVRRQSMEVAYNQSWRRHSPEGAPLDNSDSDVARVSVKSPPPPLPNQGLGPHVEVDEDGVIRFTRPKDLEGTRNNTSRLRAMHPDMRNLAAKLCERLSAGNVPHATLKDRITSYAELIDLDLEGIDFTRLFMSGVRLENGLSATRKAISVGDEPEFDAEEEEEIESLLTLHGAFILATEDGQEALESAERWNRTAEDDTQYRRDVAVIAAILRRRPDIIDPVVLDEVSGIASEIGVGPHPGRGAVIGRGATRNVAISVVSGAFASVIFEHPAPIFVAFGAVGAFIGTLAISETVKKTAWFQMGTKYLASGADKVLDSSVKDASRRFGLKVQPHRQFVSDNEEALRRLAGKRPELRFIHQALNWLKGIDESSQVGSRPEGSRGRLSRKGAGRADRGPTC